MRREEPKSLAAWLESKGNPKHQIAKGENGSMVIAIEDKTALNPGVTVYNYNETELPNGHKHFWISSGWCVRNEYLPALRGLLNDELAEVNESVRVTFAEYRKGKYKAFIKFFNYPGIGSGFRVDGNEKIECYSRRFRDKIPYDLGQEFTTLTAAQKFLKKNGYKEAKKGGTK